MLRLMWLAALVLCLPIVGSGGAAAQSSKLTVVIGYTPGAAYDIYARTVARHLGKYLPERPVVVPQSMAGAGSLKAADFLYKDAAGDGSIIGIRNLEQTPSVKISTSILRPARKSKPR